MTKYKKHKNINKTIQTGLIALSSLIAFTTFNPINANADQDVRTSKKQGQIKVSNTDQAQEYGRTQAKIQEQSQQLHQQNKAWYQKQINVEKDYRSQSLALLDQYQDRSDLKNNQSQAKLIETNFNINCQNLKNAYLDRQQEIQDITQQTLQQNFDNYQQQLNQQAEST